MQVHSQKDGVFGTLYFRNPRLQPKMKSKKFEQLIRRLADNEQASSAAEVEAGWQRLVGRLDKPAALPPVAFFHLWLTDRPGPHGCLSLKQGKEVGTSTQRR